MNAALNPFSSHLVCPRRPAANSHNNAILQRSSGGKTLRPGDTGQRFEVSLPGQASDCVESIVVHQIANKAEVVDVNVKLQLPLLQQR